VKFCQNPASVRAPAPEVGQHTEEVLLELGFISERDLRWALEERNKKVGMILKEMKLVSDYDIDCALMLEQRGRLDKSGRIIDME